MKTKSLLQVSFSIEPESEEAVSALVEDLFGHPPVIHLDYQNQRTTASLYLSNIKKAREPELSRLRDGLRQLRRIGLRTLPARLRLAWVKHEDWAESWKLHFKPFKIGNRLLIKPTWSDLQPSRGQRIVQLDPGLSFGTGQHPTTRFCLQELVKNREGARTQSFLDVGTGSGILAIAGAILGYRPVKAFDIDPDSVRIAKENAKINRVQNLLEISQADLFALNQRTAEKFDVIAANLTDDILRKNHLKLLRRMNPGGILILAGILGESFAKVQACFEHAGAKLASWKREKEWQSGAFTI